VTYIHTDALGSPVLETNAQAQVVRQVDYRAYGMEVMDAPRPGPGYTGHYRDVGTGLVYMQQRYYDPVVGRFLSADPVATDTKNGWNLNRYNYAANNPYKFTDPDGREIRIIGSEEFVKRIEAQLADAEAASTKIADMVGGLRDSANVHEIRDISESPRNQLQSHNIATDPSGRIERSRHWDNDLHELDEDYFRWRRQVIAYRKLRARTQTCCIEGYGLPSCG
jgi:RHS repeat-associated protein